MEGSVVGASSLGGWVCAERRAAPAPTTNAQTTSKTVPQVLVLRVSAENSPEPTFPIRFRRCLWAWRGSLMQAESGAFWTRFSETRISEVTGRWDKGREGRKGTSHPSALEPSPPAVQHIHWGFPRIRAGKRKPFQLGLWAQKARPFESYTYTYKISKQLEIATPSCLREVNSAAGDPFSIAPGRFPGSRRRRGRKALAQAPSWDPLLLISPKRNNGPKRRYPCMHIYRVPMYTRPFW